MGQSHAENMDMGTAHVFHYHHDLRTLANSPRLGDLIYLTGLKSEVDSVELPSIHPLSPASDSLGAPSTPARHFWTLTVG